MEYDFNITPFGENWYHLEMNVTDIPIKKTQLLRNILCVKYISWTIKEYFSKSNGGNEKF